MESTNDKLAVRNAPVQLEWASDIDNATMRLDEGATLDFGLDQSTRASFYKIRVRMALKGSRKKVSFFLLIIPEDIRVFDITHGPSTSLSLHTTLSQRSSFLVVPRSYALQNKKAYDTFDLLKSLSRATSFSSHLTDAKDDDLASFQAASKLFAECRDGFRTDGDEYGLDRFYNGAGGVVQIDHPPGSTGSSSPDPLQLGCPPLYDEVSLSPPPPLPPARRRRRGSSPSSPSPSSPSGPVAKKTKKSRPGSPPPPPPPPPPPGAKRPSAPGREKSSGRLDGGEELEPASANEAAGAEAPAPQGETPPWATAYAARQTALEAQNRFLAGQLAVLQGQMAQLAALAMAAKAATATPALVSSVDDRPARSRSAPPTTGDDDGGDGDGDGDAEAGTGYYEGGGRVRGRLSPALRDRLVAVQAGRAGLRREVEERGREVDRRVEERLAEFKGRLDEWFEQRFEQRFEEASDGLEERMEGKIEECVARKMMEGVDERFEEAVDDAVERADVMVEEKGVLIKDEMITFIKEEMQNLKEELMDGFDLGNAVLRVEFDR